MSQTFATVAQFTYSSEAKIIQGRLESDGIATFLIDANTIDTDPLVSNAIGGVKLKVRFEDEQRAREILEEINQYSLTNDGEPIQCPNCKGSEVDYFSNVNSMGSLVAFLIGFLFGALPFYTRYDYRCRECKTKFKLNE